MDSDELVDALRRELLQALSQDDPTERLLEVVGVISEALRGLGVEPVVVGGLAMAYWSGGAFATGDIDVVARRSADFHERLEALGFRRQGRVWLLDEGDVILEAPSEALEPGDRAESAELASGRHILVLSPEDLLLWRLREWVHWAAVSGFWQAAHLLAMDALDQARLDTRADEEGLRAALDELRRMAGEVEAGRTYETWELIEVARAVERRSYDQPP